MSIKLLTAIAVMTFVFANTYIVTPKQFNAGYEVQEHAIQTCSIGWIIGSLVNLYMWYLGV